MRLLAAAATLLVALGCGDKRVARPPESIIIAVPSWAHAALIQVAMTKGYFASEGLEVTVQVHQTGRLALAAMLEGKAHFAACSETVVVFAALQGRQPSVLASISSSTRSTAVVTRDARVAGPKDLAGKRVGISRGTSAEFFLDTLLLRHGVGRETVRLVELSPADMLNALSRGEVDAVSIWEPYLSSLLKQLGGQGRAFYVDDIYAETHDLVTRRDFVQQRPAAVEKVLRALTRAEALFREHPPQARQLAAAALKLEAYDADALLARFDYRVRLDQSLLVLMEEEARWAIRSGLVAKQDTPNFRATLVAGPLVAVKPGAVGLIR